MSERHSSSRLGQKMRPQAKRQRYTLVACNRCKRRKTKCSGTSPCHQCVKRDDKDCFYDRLLPTIATSSPSCRKPPNPPTPPNPPNGLEEPRLLQKIEFESAIWPLSRTEAIEILESFREDVETLYPFINLDEVERLASTLDVVRDEVQQPGDIANATSWDGHNDSRNVDFLKLLLACAIAPGEDSQEKLSRGFMLAVEQAHFKRTRSMDVDLKDLAIATMLSVYQYQCDKLKLAWRQIGCAVRICLELGLHKPREPSLIDCNTENVSWGNKLFWIIYVLDRRYSFMNNLPFSFQDNVVDFDLLQPDNSSPYLLPMVVYGRLGAKIVPASPKFGSISEGLDERTRLSLGIEIDHWMETATIQTKPSQSSALNTSKPGIRDLYHREIFFRIRGNMMRLSLYKDKLFTPAKIRTSSNFAHLAVKFARDTVTVLVDGDRSGSNENILPHHYGFFLASSLATLYLALRNAHQQFLGTSIDCFKGLGLLRSWVNNSRGSSKLRGTFETLEKAISSLKMPPLDTDCRLLPMTFVPPQPQQIDSSFRPSTVKQIGFARESTQPIFYLPTTIPQHVTDVPHQPTLGSHLQEDISTTTPGMFLEPHNFLNSAIGDVDNSYLWECPMNFMNVEAIHQVEELDGALEYI